MGEWTICALEGCDEGYFKNVHNQRFHSAECARIFTNARILKQYHDNKNRDLAGRTCRIKDCHTILSSYNTSTICGVCEYEKNKKKWRSWGWTVSD